MATVPAARTWGTDCPRQLPPVLAFALDRLMPPMPALRFSNVTTWTEVPFAEASERFDFMAATNDSVDYGDIFPDEPEHLMVHEGDVKTRGVLVLDGMKLTGAARDTVYIIDGDLELDGPIVFQQADVATTLWVTGNVRAKRLALTSCGMLIVGKSLEIAELVLTDLEDAGHLIVHGSMTAPTWIDLAQGRGAIELGTQPATRFLSDHYGTRAPTEIDADDESASISPDGFASEPASPAILPALVEDGRPSTQKIVDAMRSGEPVLR